MSHKGETKPQSLNRSADYRRDEKPTVLPYYELHLNCLRWGEWSRSRRLYAPVLAKTVLCRLRYPDENNFPDAELDGELNLLNKAINSLPDSSAKRAFLAYYRDRVRMRDLVDFYNRSKTTLWCRIESVRSAAYLVYIQLVAKRYADQTVVSLAERRRLQRAATRVRVDRYSTRREPEHAECASSSVKT